MRRGGMARSNGQPPTAGQPPRRLQRREPRRHGRLLPAGRVAAGRSVLCDRFTDATYAYQGAGRGLAEEGIRQLETLVQATLRPDLTLLLDVPVHVGLTRARRRNAGGGLPGGAPEDRFEAQRAEFFERVRAAYLARASAEPRRMVVIDASPPADDVTAQITDALRSRAWIS